MSGFEIAGVVLGGLPLLISAIEHYDDTVRPFKRWRKFVPELELFRLQLELERTTFRNDCRILLGTLTDRQTAQRALESSLRTDASLVAKYNSRLGDSVEICDDTIRVIRKKLAVIEKEGEKFGLVMKEQTLNDAALRLAWRLRAKEKLKFVFSQPHLRDILADLRIFTQAFTKLCSQIQRLDAPTAHQVSDQGSTKLTKRIQDCQQIQRASSQLYDALCKACSTHDSHSAQFKLEPRHVDFDENGVPIIRFNIAFTQPCSEDERLISDPTWLAIESILGIAEPQTSTPTSTSSLSGLLSPSTIPTLSIHNLNQNLKRTCESLASIDHKRLRSGKTVSFAATTVHTSNQVTVEPSRTTDTNLPDFCLQQDFCTCVQRYSQHTLENPDRHIGYLQKTGPYKNLVYFSSPKVCRQPTQTSSLAELMAKMSLQQRAGSTIPLERVRLAKQLCSAVLQFHDTPLLKRTWRSQDVIFFDSVVDTTAQRQTLTLPHLNVLVRGTKAVAAARTSSSSSDVNELLVRNLYLFNLAIVLLEIAYQKPFENLREESSITNVADGILRDLLVAKELSEKVSTQLGSEYGDVVKKCLHCDFNTGSSDLNNQILQTAVYREVVMKLEDLEIGIVNNIVRSY